MILYGLPGYSKEVIVKIVSVGRAQHENKRPTGGTGAEEEKQNKV